MSEQAPETGNVARTIVLAGFAILGLMASGTLGVILYLYATGHEPPQGLTVIFTGVAGVTVTTFAGIVKDYMGKVQA